MRGRVAVVVAALLLAGCGGSTSSTAGDQSSTETSQTEQDTAADTCARLLTQPDQSGTCHPGGATEAIVAARGTPLKLSDLTVEITGVRTAKTVSSSDSGESHQTSAQGTFVILTLKIKNTDSKSLDWEDQLDGRTTLNINGKSFDHNGDAESDVPGELYKQPIPPDGSDTRTMVYDVTDPNIGHLHDPDSVLNVISTRDLLNGDDVNSASSIGVLHLPQ